MCALIPTINNCNQPLSLVVQTQFHFNTDKAKRKMGGMKFDLQASIAADVLLYSSCSHVYQWSLNYFHHVNVRDIPGILSSI